MLVFLLAVFALAIGYRLVQNKHAKSAARPSRRIDTERAGESITLTIRAEIVKDDADREPQSLFDDPADAWEGSFWEVQAPLPVNAQLRLRYRDGNGQVTSREVDVRQIGAVSGTDLVIGHCRSRDATRTFRVDRILECVDLETGEVIENAGAFLRNRYEQSPEASLARLLDSDFDSLRILLFVGKADGQLRAPERAVILHAAIALAHDTRISQEILDGAIQNMDVPSLQAFKMAVNRCRSRAESDRTLIVDSARQIVATQRTVHPAEADAIGYLERNLLGNLLGQ